MINKMKKRKSICVLCGQEWGVENRFTNVCENPECGGGHRGGTVVAERFRCSRLIVKHARGNLAWTLVKPGRTPF